MLPPNHSGNSLLANTDFPTDGFVVSIWIILEPLFGVIEGVSAGLFLIGMLVAVVALFICRQKVK